MSFFKELQKLEGKIPPFRSNGQRPEDYETFTDLADEVFFYYYSEAKTEFEEQYRAWLSQKGMQGYRDLLELEWCLEKAGVGKNGQGYFDAAERAYIRWREEGKQQALDAAGSLMRTAGVITARTAALEDVKYSWLHYGDLGVYMNEPLVPYLLYGPKDDVSDVGDQDEIQEMPEGARKLRRRAVEENITASDFGGKTVLFYDWCGDILNCCRTAAMGRLDDWGIFVKGTQGKRGENLTLMIERLKGGESSGPIDAPF